MSQSLYEQSASLHQHLCPKQVLGVRMGTLGGSLLGISVPQKDKRLMVIAETDGCFSDGVAVATNCWVGRRTLRIEDYGKVAATFVDTQTCLAIRVRPHDGARALAREFAPDTKDRWHAYLFGYQAMPDELLFDCQQVALQQSVEWLLSDPEALQVCDHCAEEIINQREFYNSGRTLCRTCAGEGYYQVISSDDQSSFVSPEQFRPAASLVAGR